MPPEGCKKPSCKIPHLHSFYISVRVRRLIFATHSRLLSSQLTQLRHPIPGDVSF
jgi:hypothetical protein